MSPSSLSDSQEAGRLNADIRSLFQNLLRFRLLNPGLLYFLCAAFMRQNRAIRRREAHLKTGLQVPAFMIISVTAQCNLRCAGCYSEALHERRGHMRQETLRKALSEARELGVGMALISGGEPFSYPGLLEILKEYPEIIFPIFTNGQLITEEHKRLLRKNRHLIPIISLEGGEKETDARRGAGVFARAASLVSDLWSMRVLSGISLTVTRENFAAVFSPDFVRAAVKRGSRLIFYVEYIPADKTSESLVPDAGQVRQIPDMLKELRKSFPALFFAFPYEEEEYGGCLASGRGFIHINSAGGVEPCPFAPYSDTDITRVSLKDALSSRLLRVIRDNHDKLSETGGGCALWKNREWLKSIVQGNDIVR